MKNEIDLESFLHDEALDRFLRYVQVDTNSNDESNNMPSSEGQRELALILKSALEEMGITEAGIDGHGYLYARLPASPGAGGTPVSFMSHLDTSSSVSGKNVKAVIHKNYDGGVIRYEDDRELALSPSDSPELLEFVGKDIITASGKTLLGADDKAGLAEIMAGLAALKKFTGLRHPELRICFTPDEEIGRGTDRIDVSKLGKICYTFDGGMIGELETECFDARGATVVFHGLNVHPGYAKGKMINAAAAASRFFSALPERETPERTEGREGFFHLLGILGDESEATLRFIIRDFESSRNDARADLLESLKKEFLARYPGLKITLNVSAQYRNMREVLDANPSAAQKAMRAMEMAGIKIRRTAIRGGTDGARLSFMGIPTPNIFVGGLLFHSKKEWIPVVAFEKAAMVMINLCSLWAE